MLALILKKNFLTVLFEIKIIYFEKIELRKF
jgi:hypothetical protein